MQVQTQEKKVITGNKGRVFIASNFIREREMLDKEGKVITLKRKIS